VGRNVFEIAPAEDLRMEIEIDLDREDDGRWIAEAVDLPGVLAYGATRGETWANAQALAKAVIAEESPED
jgi:predicted RNase H-like HicB family nuclease